MRVTVVPHVLDQLQVMLDATADYPGKRVAYIGLGGKSIRWLAPRHLGFNLSVDERLAILGEAKRQRDAWDKQLNEKLAVLAEAEGKQVSQIRRSLGKRTIGATLAAMAKEQCNDSPDN